MKQSIKKSLIIITAAVILLGGIRYFIKHRNTVELPSNVLIVGTSPDYQPYSFVKDGIVQGFEVDLTQEIAQRLGKEYKLKIMNFDVLLLELQRGSVHMIASGITPLEERKLRVDFTKPYSQGDPLFAISRNNEPSIHTIKDLYGKTVVVNEGYTADSYLSKIKEIHLQRVETIAEGILSLQRHRADLFVAAQSAVEPFFKNHSRSEFTITVIPEITDNYALVIAKNNKPLLEKVNAILDELTEDGTLDDFKHRWGIK